MVKKSSGINSQISSLLRRLLKEKGINPSKLVLFGSYATRKETDESDIDLIVVSPDFRDKGLFERVRATSGIGRALVKRFKKPFDLLFYSDVEWDKADSVVIDIARREGMVLHG